jgi:hypothetical protein
MTAPADLSGHKKCNAIMACVVTVLDQVTSIEPSLPQLTAHVTRVSTYAALRAYKSDLVSITFQGVEDVELILASGGGRRIRKPEQFLPELRVDDLSAPMPPLLLEQFNILGQASGWAGGSPSSN